MTASHNPSDPPLRSAGHEVWPVVIIGTGFAGLGMAIQLQEAGIGPFVLLERAAELGGTWRDNHYPGCACDVPAPLYSFSFMPHPGWSRLYARHDEIQRYLLAVAERYRLRQHIRFSTTVDTIRYDDATRLWTITTAGGDSYRAKVVVSAVGALSNPLIPDIPGASEFAGETFHSATWDHDVPLEGKRVAVVGTGASAIQFVPEIAPRVGHLDLFQRTPPWVMPRPDRSISQWEQTLYRRVPLAQKALRGWIYCMHELRGIAFTSQPRLMQIASRSARLHLERQVPDPVLRAKLTPNYTIGCKRVLLSDDYYPALTRDNVEVVTTGIERITADGVVTRDGQHHRADVLIYGTGFRVQQPFGRGTVFGRRGQDINDAWAERMVAYKGTTVAGFPNLFVLAGPNTGLGHSSMVYMIESQVAYVIDALRQMERGRWDTVEITPEAMARFNEDVDGRLSDTVWSTGCRSWYLDERGRNTTLWPDLTFRFRQQTRRFDASNYRIELQPQTQPAPHEGRPAAVVQ